MADDRTLSRETLSRMISAVEPEASLRAAEPAGAGHLPVYHVAVETPDGTTDLVVKASPDGDRHGIDTEARLLSLLGARTRIPVPAVIGAVDAHDDLPAPYLVMESVDGVQVPKRDVGELSDPAIECLVRRTGEYLAELHAIGGIDGFGRLVADPDPPLRGGRPSDDPDQLTVDEFEGASARSPDGWPAVLETWAERALDRHASTQFADLTPGIRPIVGEGIESLSGPFRGVIGRIDHGLHNLLLRPGTGEITGVIDWGFTLAVPPVYDLVCVEANLSRGPWSMLQSTPDRRSLIRETLLASYRETGSPAAASRYREHHDLYDLLALVRAMNNLEAAMPGATGSQLSAAAEAYRIELSERYL